jgi:hypothetical protein
MGVHVAPPLIEDSHLIMFPVWPLNVNVPLFAPVHPGLTAGETVPPVGYAFTVIITVAVLVHPVPAVPVTVYVVVVVGVAVTVAPVVEDKPVAGLQLYVAAPLAVSETLLPIHSVADEGVTVTVGVVFTVIIAVAVFVHPFASVPVTV